MDKILMKQMSLTVKQNVLSVFAILALFAVACGGGDSGSSGGGSSTGGTTGTTTGTTTGPVFVPEFEVTQVEKGASELRTHYAAFGIKTKDSNSDGVYKLALRLASQTKPSAAEIKASKAVFQRNIVSTEEDYTYMTFHMDAPIFADDYVLDRLNDNTRSDYAEDDLFVRTLLQINSTYTLYLLDSTTDTVHTLKDFTTDSTPDTSQTSMYGLPPADKTYTFRLNEPFLVYARSATGAFATLTFMYESKAISQIDFRPFDMLDKKIGNRYYVGTVDPIFGAEVVKPNDNVKRILVYGFSQGPSTFELYMKYEN